MSEPQRLTDAQIEARRAIRDAIALDALITRVVRGETPRVLLTANFYNTSLRREITSIRIVGDAVSYTRYTAERWALQVAIRAGRFEVRYTHDARKDIRFAVRDIVTNNVVRELSFTFGDMLWPSGDGIELVVCENKDEKPCVDIKGGAAD